MCFRRAAGVLRCSQEQQPDTTIRPSRHGQMDNPDIALLGMYLPNLSCAVPMLADLGLSARFRASYIWMIGPD